MSKVVTLQIPLEFVCMQSNVQDNDCKKHERKKSVECGKSFASNEQANERELSDGSRSSRKRQEGKKLCGMQCNAIAKLNWS